MRFKTLAAWLVVPAALASASALSASAPSDPAPEAASRALADRFQRDLLEALSAALADGGPVGAVKVCAEVAPAIAARLSQDSGAVVRRTALRTRNPAAAPDPYERGVLEALAEAPMGTDGRPREVSAWAGEGEGRRFRYMRAIPTAPVCLSCHGEAIKPEVQEAIRQAYPQDTATGFKAGELRGAFSISWDASALAAFARRPAD